jgi:hypothetical protein
MKTEEEALATLCPFAFVPIEFEGGAVTANRWGDGDRNGPPCIAGKCAAWEWVEEKQDGYVEAFMAWRDRMIRERPREFVEQARHWEALLDDAHFVQSDEFKEIKSERRGFCRRLSDGRN